MKFALEREVRLEMEAAAELAKSFIGQEVPGWAPLTPSTIADKERQGFPVPAPLKRTSELQDSIHGEAESVYGGVRGVVGSTDEIAIFHEHGTSKLPPRPFLGPALMLAEPLIEKSLGALAVRALTPGENL